MKDTKTNKVKTKSLVKKPKRTRTVCAKFEYSTIDPYIKEICPQCENITDAVDILAGKLNCSRSAINRWRMLDSISKAEDILDIIMEVNKTRPDGNKCTMKDIAILCNYKGKFRKKPAK